MIFGNMGVTLRSTEWFSSYLSLAFSRLGTCLWACTWLLDCHCSLGDEGLREAVHANIIPLDTYNATL